MIVFRKISFYLALFGVIAAASLILRLRATITEPVTPPPLTPPAKPFAQGIGASGIVEAQRENTLVGVPQPGLVTKLYVSVWDKVAAGAPLLQLDDRDLRATLIGQTAQIRVAEATLHRVRDQLSRLQSISDPRAISADDLKNRTNEVAVAQAQLDAARAALEQTNALIDRLTVRAPIAGTILQVNVRVGENISTSLPSIVLGDIEQVQVRADVDEQIAPRIKPGKKAVGYLKGDSSHPIPLEFVRIEPFVIPKRSLTGASTERVDTRVLQVIFRLPADTGRTVYVGQQMDLFIEE